ncbi:MAG: ATP-binding protein [Leadbetterella sp.]|nr:ATP-binding protein [Leadbetterella sp.]
MKTPSLLFVILLSTAFGFSQKLESIKIDSLEMISRNATNDSLETQLRNATNDTTKAKLVLEIIDNVGRRGGNLLENLNNGRYAPVYDAYSNKLDVYENPENQLLFNRIDKKGNYYDRFWGGYNNELFNYGMLMGVTANTEEQLHYFKKAYQMAKERNRLWQQTSILSNMAFSFQHNNRLDSAQFYIDRIFANPVDKFGGYLFCIFYQAGDIRLESGNYEQAKSLFSKGIENVLKNNFDLEIGLSINYLGLSKVYQHLNRRDSSYYYGIKSLNLLKQIREVQLVKVDLASAYENMYQHFQQFSQRDSAFKYLQLANKERAFFTKKTISNLAAFQQVLLDRQLKLKDLQREEIEKQGGVRMYVLIATLLVFLVFGAVLLYSYLQKRKANVLLASQKEQIETTLEKLKSTQAQLIQSEKLASLGELTAGIAHEIQNPLNFVNNFSEVSSELVTEMNQELDKGDITEAKIISNDLKQNLEKITIHGKRASSIVKGMLEHSRTSTGEKELTDINALADEYLRLTYHGLRAKDNNGPTPRFNSDFKTDFDENLPKIEVVSQDMGRVLLNLINNAFYATKGVKNPFVELKTACVENGIIVSIKDNGKGMSEETKAKIFQPFFTTKPTGEGTGLGLSLAYDIVVKGHGGTLEVESKEGFGTTFMIKLPIS